MNKQSRIILAGVLAVFAVLFLFVALDLGQQHPLSSADTISAWQVTTLLDGTQAGATSEAFTAARYVPNYAHFELHVTSNLSGTGVLTVTPQFALSTVGCGGTITRWVDAADWTAASATAVVLAITNDASDYVFGDIHGVCARVKYTSDTSLFTPTMVLRMVNRP